RPCKRSREGRVRRRGGIAHPGVLGEPFMLNSANRAIHAREKYRHRPEAFAIGGDPGRNFPSCLRAADHDDAHRPLPLRILLSALIIGSCEDRLTQRRPYRGPRPMIAECYCSKIPCRAWNRPPPSSVDADVIRHWGKPCRDLSSTITAGRLSPAHHTSAIC